jgi:hypothetical protein
MRQPTLRAVMSHPLSWCSHHCRIAVLALANRGVPTALTAFHRVEPPPHDPRSYTASDISLNRIANGSHRPEVDG